MAVTPRTPASVLMALLRVALALLAAMLVLPPAIGAQDHHARLSEDLVERLRNGDTTETSVIITGTQASINAIAERHGLTVRKRLQTGAVVEVAVGKLRVAAKDSDAPVISGGLKLRAQGSA